MMKEHHILRDPANNFLTFYEELEQARWESDDRMLGPFMFVSLFLSLRHNLIILVHQKVAKRCFKHISLELWRQRRKNLLGLEQSLGCRANTESCFNDN